LPPGENPSAYEARRFSPRRKEKPLVLAAAALLPNGCSLFTSIVGHTTEEVERRDDLRIRICWSSPTTSILSQSCCTASENEGDRAGGAQRRAEAPWIGLTAYS